MNTYQTVLRKMRTEVQTPIQYYLSLEEGELPMNDLLGQQLSYDLPVTTVCTVGNPRRYIGRDSVRSVFEALRWGMDHSVQN